MKKIYSLLAVLLLTIAATAQTLNVQVGNVTYQFPSADTGDMTFTDGTTLTIMNKAFTISDITGMTVDNSEVTASTIKVVYDGTSAAMTVAGDIAQYVTPTISGAHVSIAQSSDLATEITYNLSGSSSDGEFYMEGKYKATLELNGLTLTNTTPVYSGAAVHIQNGKRIKVKVVTGTTNTLVDAASGSQKGCLYIKGHAEFAQKGTLNVTGNVKHGIKAGEYFTIKNATINVLGAVGDGISCNQYFLMESGTIKISGTGDDGIQCDIDDTETYPTGTGEIVATSDVDAHEDEDSGNMYFEGGTINITCDATAAKGIKAEGDIRIEDGTITIKTTGDGTWDEDDLDTKAACGISADGDITIKGGTIDITATGSGGKGMKCDGFMTIDDGTITIVTSGGLYYNNGTTENKNYTGDTDNVDSNYYSSPKGIKAGLKTEVSSSRAPGGPGGGGPGGGGSSSANYTYSGGMEINGGTISVTTSGTNGEGIESKNTLVINGGEITVNAYDDAINSAQDMTINDGYVYAKSSSNDGLDANGNMYIKGGVIFAICTGSNNAENALDANTEDSKKLYIQGGTLFALGNLENDASLTQSCYSASSWSKNTWYSFTVGSTNYAFKTPSSGGSKLVVSAASQPTIKSGVTASGTAIWGGVGYTDATVSGGTTVSLSNYSSGSGGGPGGW